MKMRFIFSVLFVAIGLLTMSFLPAKRYNVPQAVLDTFAAKFPKAQQVEWDEKDDEYEAEFKLNKVEMAAKFKADGTWLETEMEIDEAKLPEVVKQAITKHFKGFDLEKAEQVETPDLPLAYEVRLEDDDTAVKAFFKPDGTLLKKEIADEEEEE